MMRRSFVRLVVRSVLVFYALAAFLAGVYWLNQSWLDDRAEGDGVFLAFALLDAEAPADRPARLDALQPNFHVSLRLVSTAQLAARAERSVAPGERVPLRVSSREEWYLFAFADGEGGLAAGPINPAIPVDLVPVGLIGGLVLLPLLGALIALRVERQLSKVEAATDAIAVGELSARVDNPDGPSSELAASFNAMADRVERLIRSRDELVQAVSHELGSPLSRIRFHMALLETVEDAKREERLEAMTRELDALDELVAELLTYVQSDEAKIQPETFGLEQVLADLAELARLDVPEGRAVTVSTEVAPNLTVRADPRLFQRAIENLLRNAARYAKGTVRLVAAETPEGVRVCVQDDGPGIPADLRAKVLTPFVRLEADRGRKTGGVGLGLAIVARILERHRGRIEIGTSPLQGADVATLWPG
ncbi:MAG: ATP-binding protein [Myxococcota bacterium]